MASEDPERGGKINIGGSGDYGSHNSSYRTSSGYAIADDGERHWTSWLIPVVVVLNVAVFVVAMYVNNCPKHAAVGGSCVAGFLGRFSFQPTPENPLFGPSYSTLKKMGALEWRSVVARHQEWRLITCIWLHAGVIHLLANMLSLIFVGVRLEQQFGFGIFPHVNNFAHIGGFLTGLLLGFVLLPRPHLGWLAGQSLPSGVRVKSKYKVYQVVLWVLSLLLVIAGLAAGLVMLLRGKNGYDTCHWCRYLSCVPTSKWKCHD